MAQNYNEREYYRQRYEAAAKAADLNAELQRRQMAVQEKNAANDFQLGLMDRSNAKTKLNMDRQVQDNAIFKEGRRLNDLYANPNLTPEQIYASKYGQSGLEGLAMKAADEANKADIFWKLYNTNSGFTPEGRAIKQAGGSSGSGMDMGLGGNDSQDALNSILGIAAPGNKTDITDLLSQADTINNRLYSRSPINTGQQDFKIKIGGTGGRLNPDLARNTEYSFDLSGKKVRATPVFRTPVTKSGGADVNSNIYTNKENQSTPKTMPNQVQKAFYDSIAKERQRIDAFKKAVPQNSIQSAFYNAELGNTPGRSDRSNLVFVDPASNIIEYPIPKRQPVSYQPAPNGVTVNQKDFLYPIPKRHIK